MNKKIQSQNVIIDSMTKQGVKYVVKRFGEFVQCSCPDCQIRGRKCKHIKALESGSYPVGKVYAF
jgi:uncharacterized Zn finger protein